MIKKELTDLVTYQFNPKNDLNYLASYEENLRNARSVAERFNLFTNQHTIPTIASILKAEIRGGIVGLSAAGLVYAGAILINPDLLSEQNNINMIQTSMALSTLDFLQFTMRYAFNGINTRLNRYRSNK